MTRAQIDEHLDFAEQHFTSDDPYEQAYAYTCACLAYDALAVYQDDLALRMACHQAALMYETRAARVRFENGIPTTKPMTEVEMLGPMSCEHCGAPWQIPASHQRCPQCPQLLFGPTPTSLADVANYPEPTVVDVTNWPPAHPEE